MAVKKTKIEEKEKQYIILKEERYQVLEDMVCDKLALGYRPVGGVAIIAGRDAHGFMTCYLYQAMIKSDTFA